MSGLDEASSGSERAPAGRRGPLAGTRVLDLTRNLAGPFATMILGDLGAEVIKVEHPGAGDDTRSWTPPAWSGISPTYLSANRNKRSIAIDLDRDEGAAVVRSLAAVADVVVDSFRPGSLARRGLDDVSLRARNPRLVTCSISAFGATGPRRDRPGYDPVVQAYTGIMDLTGEPDGPPVRLGITAIDQGTGLWAAFGVVLALGERERDGHGRRVEASLFETATWWLSYPLASYLASGVAPTRQGSGVPMIAPYEAFITADGDLFVAAANDALFRRLAQVLELADLADDDRFATNPDRVANRAELRAVLQQRLLARTAVAWEQLLVEAGVPSSRVRTVAELPEDPQLQALGLLGRFTHPVVEELRLVDLPIRRDGRRAEHHTGAPQLGQHTDEVLGEVGFDANQIAALRASGVIG